MGRLSEVGATALVLHREEVYVAVRQIDNISVCTSALPKDLVAYAIENPDKSVHRISDWLLSDDRSWLFAGEDHSIYAFRYGSSAVEVMPGISMGLAEPISLDEIASDPLATDLFVKLFALARSEFKVWAEDESLAQLDAFGPTFVSLGGARPEA